VKHNIKRLLAVIVAVVGVAALAPSTAQAYLYVQTAGDHMCSLTRNAAANDFWATRGAQWSGCWVVSYARYGPEQVGVTIRHESAWGWDGSPDGSSRVCQRGDVVYGVGGTPYRNERWYPAPGSGLVLDCFW
jgi:hypothetical protein